MTNRYPKFTFNNGIDLPQLGFDVYQTPPEETWDVVQKALEAADTATSICLRPTAVKRLSVKH